METIKRSILPAVFVFCMGDAAVAQTNDTLLNIVRDELAYTMGKLQEQEVKPYYISMRVVESCRTVVSSSFGTTFSSSENKQRCFTPQIRVGDKQLDNYKYTTQGMQQNPGSPDRVIMIPMDNAAADGIRSCIWEEMLARYDMALNVYNQTKSKAATSVANEDKSNCFSDTKAEKYYEECLPKEKQQIDRSLWEKKLNAVSAVFKQNPKLLVGSASLDREVTRVYLLNTDGTEVVQNRTTARVLLQCGIRSDDGMEMPLVHEFFAYDVDSLPDTQVLINASRDLLVRVNALKNAPVANPYTGPAILSGSAAGVFFHEIFGHRLEGHRLKEGGETFKNMVGKQVLPKEFQVFCDPTLKKYAGNDLNGHYLYDSEGVKARRVNNVVNGELREFLMSRVPLDGFPQSNGHGRADATKDPVSRQSNLIVETTKPYSDEELRGMLINEAKKQGKEFGYYFRTVTSGYTTTGQGGSLNSFSVTPVEVYRVYVDGRKDELVRGVQLIGTALSMFSHIVAAGDCPATFTGSCGAESGWVPVTASAPAIFVSQIETQRQQKSQNIPPILGAPAFTSSDSNAEINDIVFAAMKDELKRTTDSLAISGSPRPFWASYTACRYRNIDIKGELGGIKLSVVLPWTMFGTSQVFVGDFKRNSEVPGYPLIYGLNGPTQPDYDSLRRLYWGCSDLGYKNSVNLYAQKNAHINSNPLPKSLESIPDMQQVESGDYIQDSTAAYHIQEDNLNNLTRELSSVFLDYLELFDTGIQIRGTQMEVYRSTSEGVNIKQPQNFLTVHAKASFRDENNLKVQDDFELVYSSPDELPSNNELKSKIKKFADDLMALKQAPFMNVYYKGPVIFEGKAASAPFVNNLLERGKLIAVQNNLQEDPKAFGQRMSMTIIDPNISIVNYSDKAEYNGVKLMGYYTVDADGITPAKETVLVEKGILRKILNKATPTQYAEESTGSARFGNAPQQAVSMAGMGTVHIKPEKTMAKSKMEKKILKLGKKKKLNNVYIVSTPEHYYSQRLYRINVKTGEKTLVRTSVQTVPSLTQLENIHAVSSEEQVENSIREYNHSLVSPTCIMLDDMELSKPTTNGNKAAVLEYPLAR